MLVTSLRSQYRRGTKTEGRNAAVTEQMGYIKHLKDPGRTTMHQHKLFIQATSLKGYDKFTKSVKG